MQILFWQSNQHAPTTLPKTGRFGEEICRPTNCTHNCTKTQAYAHTYAPEYARACVPSGPPARTQSNQKYFFFMPAASQNNCPIALLLSMEKSTDDAKKYFYISTTNLAACVCVCVCVQNLTNFCPYALISTPNVP